MSKKGWEEVMVEKKTNTFLSSSQSAIISKLLLDSSKARSSFRDGNSSSAITIFSISVLLSLWFFKTDGSTCTICTVYMKIVVRAVNRH